MMLALLGAAVALVAMPGVLDRFGRRLAPREWAWLCAAALGGGLVLLELTLVLRTLPPMLRAAGIGWMASACERMLGPLMAGGTAGSWGAGMAAVALPAAALVVWRRGRRTRDRIAEDLWLGEARVIAGNPVVVLPVARPLALSFQRDGEQFIVVSDGLLALLDDGQAAAVVRHEAAHLRYRHQRLLAIVAVAEHVLGWLPPVARSAAALHLAVERWADDDAAGTTPASRLAVRDSLLALAGMSPVLDAAGFTDARTVVARIRALEAPSPRPAIGAHLLLYVPGGAAGAIAAPALVAWGGHARMIVAMAGRCAI